MFSINRMDVYLRYWESYGFVFPWVLLKKKKYWGKIKGLNKDLFYSHWSTSLWSEWKYVVLLCHLPFFYLTICKDFLKQNLMLNDTCLTLQVCLAESSTFFYANHPKHVISPKSYFIFFLALLLFRLFSSFSLYYWSHQDEALLWPFPFSDAEVYALGFFTSMCLKHLVYTLNIACFTPL